eukprot:CAMPEP_0176258150 /NCGR_PEP_ID=MMETSP0121_2-20121125/38412_1 /TAXON_ID=160619 /ORGANISM="Kryptoperidinium foliaceum, Strain CCMP 1326" /LENGTH=239 /DNA_ID=CAMNT_0017598007 /DNA_START=176 /DNA_END=891 /DNA_ORIENTATION=-
MQRYGREAADSRIEDGASVAPDRLPAIQGGRNVAPSTVEARRELAPQTLFVANGARATLGAEPHGVCASTRPHLPLSAMVSTVICARTGCGRTTASRWSTEPPSQHAGGQGVAAAATSLKGRMGGHEAQQASSGNARSAAEAHRKGRRARLGPRPRARALEVLLGLGLGLPDHAVQRGHLPRDLHRGHVAEDLRVRRGVLDVSGLLDLGIVEDVGGAPPPPPPVALEVLEGHSLPLDAV